MCVCLIMLRLFSRLAATVRKSVKKVAESAHDMSKQGPQLRLGRAPGGKRTRIHPLLRVCHLPLLCN